MLRLSDAREVTDLRLVFKDEIIGNVEITPDWVKWLWTSPRDKLNVTVIEFSPIALKILSRTKYARLISAIPTNNMKVSVMDYDIHYNGSIIAVNKDDILIYAVLRKKNSGVPILNCSYNVVAIYNWDESNIKETLRAINICTILNCYSKYIKEKLEDKKDSEQWLEKINLIPQNEFQHIGCGGFGNVYKIKIKTKFAVKFVKSLGQLIDYEKEVYASEKEYGIVSSLDNHPRIIRFFAFINDVKNTHDSNGILRRRLTGRQT